MTYLKEVIFYGRGGMGVVTAAEILTEALAQEGKHGQTIPFYGMERRGAPVRAFARISDETIAVRSEVNEPDYVVVIDPTLPRLIDVGKGLKKHGFIVMNSTLPPGELRMKYHRDTRVASVNATKIALEELKAPIANTAMLGAFARATEEVTLESLRKAVTLRFSGSIAEQNIRAAEKAYREVQVAF